MVASQGNRGPGCATCSPSQIDVVLYPGSDRVSEHLYCTGIMSRRVGIAPPPLPCAVQQVLFSSRRVGVALPPPPFPCTAQVLFSSRRVGVALPPPPFSCTVQVLFSSRSAGIAPPPIFCWEPGLRLRLCSFSARGRLSRGIYHFSRFGGGGVF